MRRYLILLLGTILCVSACKKSTDSAGDQPAVAPVAQAPASLKVDGGYRVWFHRAVKKGQRFSFQVETTTRAVTRQLQDGLAVREQTVSVGLRATVEEKVLKIDTPQGSATVLEVKLKGAKIRSAGRDTWEEAPFEGAVIHVDRNPPLQIRRADHAPLSQPEIEALKLLYNEVRYDFTGTDQDIFGHDRVVKPGETWKLDGETLLAAYKRSDIPLVEARGNVTFEGVLGTGDKEVMALAARITGTLGGRATGKITMKMMAEYPLDTALPATTQTIRTKGKIRVTSPEGEVEVEITQHRVDTNHRLLE